MQRRDLLKSVASSAAGLTILQSGTLRGQNAPSNKLNVALIGVWGRGTAHYRTLKNENVVALCDVNDLRTKEALRIFPQAKTYWDWRTCLEQKDIEAVVICTADHHHAFIANWALNRNMHVFCEKPLGISVEEARTVRANYIKRKARLATPPRARRQDKLFETHLSRFSCWESTGRAGCALLVKIAFSPTTRISPVTRRSHDQSPHVDKRSHSERNAGSQNLFS